MIDLRSDTLTRPSAEMLEAMKKAQVGDDVFSEDPTVNMLQETVADLFGKESALFVPSGTMGNQLGIYVHCEPGAEVLVESESHIFHYETAAPAMISRVQLNPIPSSDGCPDLAVLEEAIRGPEYYYPRTALLALENTHNRLGGTVTDIGRIQNLTNKAKERGLATHLDGARIWNAMVASSVSAQAYGRCFDTLSVCLSKGLGAPIGSVFVGPSEHVERARKLRKILGGGWRQAGVIAAAGLYAIEKNISRLHHDHANATKFASIVRDSNLFGYVNTPETNIVLFDVGQDSANVLRACSQHGVLFSRSRGNLLRAVFHLDIDAESATQAAHVAIEALRTQMQERDQS